MIEWVKQLFRGKRLPRKEYVYVTEDMLSYLFEEFEKGTTNGPLAKQLNVSYSTVSRRRQQWLKLKEAEKEANM